MANPDFSVEALDRRITFFEDDEIMEVSFKDLALSTSAEVNAFYDRIEERIAGTGERLWFFLVDYRDANIDPDAWFAFSRRGKDLNMAHSMGSARYDASEITKRQIEASAGRENFDPNLFYDREGAWDKLVALPSKRRAKAIELPSFDRDDIARRISFVEEERIMEADFSRMSFEHSRDVDDVYDMLEERISATGRKWYFLVNYEDARIQSPAWVRFAARGKRLNEAWSLGSVRFAPGSETETDIRLRAESQGFRPNIRNTRGEALERIAELKAEAASGA